MSIEARYKIITIDEIKYHLKYQGYYWWSDQKKPIVLNYDKEFSIHMLRQAHPFIVEAYLYNEAEELSYTIKHLGAKYHIAAINLKGIEQEKQYVDKIAYRTHDIDNKSFKKYAMLEAWIEKPLYSSSMLAAYKERVPNINTLVPAWSAFAGFLEK